MNKRFFALVLAIVIFVQALSSGIYAKNNFNNQGLELRVEYTNNKNRENGKSAPLSKERDIDFYIKDDYLFVDGESFLKIFNYSTYFEEDSLFFHDEDVEKEPYPNLLRNGQFFKNKKIFDLAYNDPGSTTIKMPVAPFVEGGKFWIPFQFTCDVLSLKYDYSYGTLKLKSRGITIDDVFNESINFLSFPLFKNIKDIIEDDNGLYGLNTFFVTYLSRLLDYDFVDAFKWDYSMFRDVFKNMLLYEKLSKLDDLEKAVQEITKKAASVYKFSSKTENFLDDAAIYSSYENAILDAAKKFPGNKEMQNKIRNTVTYLDETKQLANLKLDKFMAGYTLVDFTLRDVIGASVDMSFFDPEVIEAMTSYFYVKMIENPDVKFYKGAFNAIAIDPVINHITDKLPSMEKISSSIDTFSDTLKIKKNYWEVSANFPHQVFKIARSLTDLAFSKYIDSAEEYQKAQYSGFITENFRLDFINEYYKLNKSRLTSKDDVEQLRSLVYLALVARYTNNNYMSKAISTINDGDALKVIKYLKEDDKKVSDLIQALKDIEVKGFDDNAGENIIELILTDKNYAKLYIKKYSDLFLINKILHEHDNESDLSNIFKDINGKDKDENKISDQESKDIDNESRIDGCRIVLMLDLASMYPPMDIYQDYYDLETGLASLIDEFLSANENNAFSLITNEYEVDVSSYKLQSDEDNGNFAYESYDIFNDKGRQSEYFMQYYNKFEDRKFIDEESSNDQVLSFFEKINSPGYLNRKSDNLKEIAVYVGNYFVETEGEYADASEATIRPRLNNILAEYDKYAKDKITYSMEFVDEITEALRTSKYKYSDELMRSLQNSGFRKVASSEDIIKFLKDIIKIDSNKKTIIKNNDIGKENKFFKSYSNEDFKIYAIDNFGYDTSNSNDKIFVDDYDGDGRREAYVIINLEDDYYKLYFINYELESVDINYDWNQKICAGLGTPDRLVNAGKDKYLIFWENMYGPGVTSHVMSANGKEPYFPDIINNISLFYEENGKYFNASSYIEPVYDDKGNQKGGVRKEKLIEYIYDKRSRQFIKK